MRAKRLHLQQQLHQELHEQLQEQFGQRDRGGRGGRSRGPGGRGRSGHRRRSRVSRGEVRNAVLILLAEEPMHGYQIMQEMEERSGGGWQPSPGSIYPTLSQLADEDLIVSEPEGGKNIFSLTEAGRAAVETIEEPPAWVRFADDGETNSNTIRRAVFKLGAAARTVAATGTEQQLDAAEAIIDDARKAIYRLLAADD